MVGLRGFATQTLDSAVAANMVVTQGSFSTPPSAGDFGLFIGQLLDGVPDAIAGVSSFAALGGAGTDSSTWEGLGAGRTAGASEPSYTVDCSNASTPFNAACLIAFFAGLTNESTATDGANLTNASLVSPSVVAAAATDYLVTWVQASCGAAQSPVFTQPGGMTLIGQASSAGTHGGIKTLTAMAYLALSASGATGAKTWTHTGTILSGSAAGSFLLKLAPVAPTSYGAGLRVK